MSAVRTEERDGVADIIAVAKFGQRNLVGDRIEIDEQQSSPGRERDIGWEAVINSALDFPGIGRRAGIVERHRRRGNVEQFDVFIVGIVLEAIGRRVEHDFVENHGADQRVRICGARSGPELLERCWVVHAKGGRRHRHEIHLADAVGVCAERHAMRGRAQP